ncbi:MAG: hypothetical protein QI223_04080 [Candidatus Korarchaeota archaeon]|nr:hypothetical protein [Candidatus Korarchaeota archaeon]
MDRKELIRTFAKVLTDVSRGGDRSRATEVLQTALKDAEESVSLEEGEIQALRGIIEALGGRWPSSFTHKLIAAAGDGELLRLLQERLDTWSEDITELTPKEAQYIYLWSELIEELRSISIPMEEEGQSD